MKKIIALLLAVAMLLGLCACGTKPKEFAVKEMKITLTDAFKERDLEGYDKSFDSSKAAVFVLREDKSQLGGLTLTLKEYADLVHSSNVNRNPGEVKEEEGIFCFEYDNKNEDTGTVYHYYTAMFESGQAFWIVQFATRQDDWAKLRPEILSYAKSVKFQ